MQGSLPIEPHIVVCFGNSVKDEKRDCGSKVIMSGVNSNVIMSGYGDENPNDMNRLADLIVKILFTSATHEKQNTLKTATGSKPDRHEDC